MHKRGKLVMRSSGITASLIWVPSESTDIHYRLKVAPHDNKERLEVLNCPEEAYVRDRVEYFEPIKYCVNTYLTNHAPGGSLHQPRNPGDTLKCRFRITPKQRPSTHQKLMFLAAIISLFRH